MPGFVTLTPTSATIAEGSSTIFSLSFVDVDVVDATFSYTLNLSGTASADDLFMLDGNGRLNLNSPEPTTRTTTFEAFGLEDNLTEGNESFFIDVQLDGITFEGGATFQRFQYFIGDDSSNTATNGNDDLVGTAGNDVINALAGDDSVEALAGNDQVDLGSGNDFMTGGDGNDTAFGNSGDDRMFMGAGDDSVQGGTGNDIIGGAPGNDQLFGEAGDDTLFGGDGQDTLVGGDGNDTIWSGTGNDLVIGTTLVNGVFVQSANDAANTLGGGIGDDTIRGGSGVDVIYGGKEAGRDNIETYAGNDEIFAGLGEDFVDAGEGNDLMFGGAGNDTVFGGSGDDTIWGSAGDDVMRGGLGADTFGFIGGSGDDTIEDFVAGTDLLDISAYVGADASAIVQTAVAVTGGVEITLGGSDTVTLLTLGVGDISESMFI